MIYLKRQQNGFTLIELMIVIAIMGILAATAIPQYVQYTKSAKFSEVVSQTASYKAAVSSCVQDINAVTGCSAGSNRIPPGIAAAQGHVNSLTVADGVITATGTAEVDSRTYVLTPNYNAATNTLQWGVTGTCLAANLCSN